MRRVILNDALLKALAVAIVDQPRASLKDLADSVGVSKATLHRLCGTREQLVDQLMNHTSQVMLGLLESVDMAREGPAGALRTLIEQHLAQRELMLFLIFQYTPDALRWTDRYSPWKAYVEGLDSFFLEGQRQGLFRIDVPAPVLADLFASLLCGMIDSERLGRAAPASSASTLERFFLEGASA
ncbi:MULTISPECIES: TetR/AcrR family transcriptional regulator [unclassified Pseudomonas]|uniref:TetR/AcrR family transcriptional regulator n=1 Tax=unclassified Pseudomonas TaxID=196821 RepID=UPI000BDAC613|nr:MULTISPECIES: TetR/AcrR family transcriptional regulator [unclassified Pseudomonas]PVZ20209.1 TetR/AcrR family transcriptional repressor of mexCD-oprJ operon [Pseudomonas sp. URIL14HWK12:I12]PVZ27275.1 TetR/AcrR family transcriptional repressor of mexCD-oprJ operon [Pseudomonas sp. URIL14HWK12:I10]PVZ38164.1 TetR/AcrR family transcriptional repressor of mexCD-oprJ operon [Pseudomonas sp. URIL14HWK12:I11]SNZ04367.1 transcriptional regulator, LacI family [Pseudomonas sp. URIL14HWK12:I9]